MTDITPYITLLQVAYQISEELVSIIKNYAAKELSPQEYAALEAAWAADIVESAHNAGF